MAFNDSPGRLTLVTLGGLRLVDAGGREPAAGQRKLLALLAYVALEAPRAPTRDELATLMWGERRDENARASLRQALFQLKRLVGDTLDVGPEAVALRSEAIEVDVLALQVDIDRGDLRSAALRWNGEFLAGADDVGGEGYRAWLDAERARARELATRAFDAVTAEASARGAWAEVASWADRWTRVDPLAEGPTRRLAEALSLAGRNAEALARHAAFVARHRAEMGTGPSEDFIRLGARLERRAHAAVQTPARGVSALLPPELVGRGDAYETLAAAWRDAQKGGPVVVVVEGEVGAGKTRLVEELVRGIQLEQRDDAVVLHVHPHDVLHVHPHDGEHAPLATARKLFSGLATAPGLIGAPASALAELASVVPEIASQVAALPPASGVQRALDDGIARVMMDVAAEAAVVVIVDDVARADAESRRLVLSLIRRARPAPILWVLTGTAAEVHAIDELRGGDALCVRLPPLDISDVESLLASMLRVAPESRRDLVERIVAQVGSYPLDVVATVRTLVDREHLAPDGAGIWRLGEQARRDRLPLARAVRDAIARRIDSLDESVRLVLEAAAVASGASSEHALAEMTSCDPDAVGDALDELHRRRLVRLVSGPDSGAALYEPASEWLRRVVAERIPDERRANLRAPVVRAAEESETSPSAHRWLDRLEDRYAVGAVIAEGKLVATLEGRHVASGQDVVLHVLRGGAITAGASFARALERVAAFSHPRVLPIVDFGATPEALFYATPRVDAVTLRERLARERPLAVDDSVRIASDVAAALAAAHECGILHGDLRPKHISLASQGVQVAGLGIVQALGAQEGQGGPDGTGVTIGAPAYLSPEQLSGESAPDARSDIYSLGCILYEMLVGELPFTGTSRSVIARKLTHAAPSARSKRESLPKSVDRVVRTCLARVPADRFATMGQVVEELSRVSG